MKIKLLIAILIFLFPSLCVGQTKATLEDKYGKTKFYEIRPKILMTAKFDDNSDICEAVLQPIHYSGNTFNTINNFINSKDLKSIIDELAPNTTRGKLRFNSPLEFDVNGWMKYRIFLYENIEVQTEKSIFIKEDEQTEALNIAEDNFGSAHVVVIKWSKRNCESSR